jgi:hypothetical protein
MAAARKLCLDFNLRVAAVTISVRHVLFGVYVGHKYTYSLCYDQFYM